MNHSLSSASSTLIIPGVGVSTYKNIGFLINADLANCFHISKVDSVSSGDIQNGDFSANQSDFSTIQELAFYIRENNATRMNEVNIAASIDSVVGLFINQCPSQEYLLQMIFVVRACLMRLTGIEYPIYLYDNKNGGLDKIELTDELEMEIISNLKSRTIFYWPDEYEEPIFDEIKSSSKKAR